MRKNIIVISCLMVLFACGGKKTQMEIADAATADSTVVIESEKTDSTPDTPQTTGDNIDSTPDTPQSYRLTGTIGEDKASMTFERDSNNLTGVVSRCDYCDPITVKGTWQGEHIEVDGFSPAGSHLKYELTVTDNAVQGSESLSAEGEVEMQNVKMSIVKQ